jgi:hypothetical protein
MTTEEILHRLSGLQIQTLHKFGKSSTAVRQFDVLMDSVRREQNYIDLGINARQDDCSDAEEYTKAHAADRINDARAINQGKY